MDKPENVSEKNLFALKGGGGGKRLNALTT